MSKCKQQVICTLSLIMVALCAGVIALIFYPANMSPDSIDQYGQALSSEFNNVHPPIMAIILSFIIRLGGNIGLLMLIQSVLGSLGVFYLSFVVARSQKLTSCVACIVAAFIYILCVSPVSPLSIYLTTFWKDTWTLIFFLWIISLSIHLILSEDISNICFVSILIIILSLMGVVMIVRHNTIVMAPLFIAFIFFLLKIKRKFDIKVCILLCLIPLIVLFSSNFIINKYFDVKKMDMWRQVVVLDLIGMVVSNESLCDDLAFTCSHLDDTYRDRYVFGFNGPILYQKPPIIKGGYWNSKDELFREYKAAFFNFPADWLHVKFLAFMGLIDCRRTIHWFYTGIHRAQYKRIADSKDWLQQNEQLSGLRDLLVNSLRKVEQHAVFRWISAVHLVWIGFNLFLSTLFALWYLYSRRASMLLFFLLSLFPLSYYFSYFLATVEFSFRFMYPSTLVIQVCIVSYIVSRGFRGTKSGTSALISDDSGS